MRKSNYNFKLSTKLFGLIILVITCFSACSQDDEFEIYNQQRIQTLAKRNIEIRGEIGGTEKDTIIDVSITREATFLFTDYQEPNDTAPRPVTLHRSYEIRIWGGYPNTLQCKLTEALDNSPISNETINIESINFDGSITLSISANCLYATKPAEYKFKYTFN